MLQFNLKSEPGLKCIFASAWGFLGHSIKCQKSWYVVSLWFLFVLYAPLI